MNTNRVDGSSDSLIPQWLEEQCFRLKDEGSDLRNLNLNIRRLNFVTMNFLSKALKDNKRIESVNMTSSLSNNINDGNHHWYIVPRNSDKRNIIFPLSNAIRKHVSLKTLHLSYNRLKDVTPLGRNLEMNQSSLMELYLDHNQLGVETAVTLARVIRQNHKLTVLQLNSNNLGDKGGKIIAEALNGNTCLKTLGLAHNSLMSETGYSLMRSLECNRNVTLVRLFLDENPKIPSLEHNISYLLRANRAGRYLLQNDDNPLDN